MAETQNDILKNAAKILERISRTKLGPNHAVFNDVGKYGVAEGLQSLYKSCDVLLYKLSTVSHYVSQ